MQDLTPTAVTGPCRYPSDACANCPWDRRTLSAFTVGDQLLWGAAEPVVLRRMLRILPIEIRAGF